MFKKITSVFIVLLILSGLFNISFAAAPELNAKAAILIDAKTGNVLYEKEADKKMYPASTTKIMTAILTLENCKLDDVAIASHNAVYSIPYGYSVATIQEGEELTIEQLLNVLLIPSANDAAVVLAEHIAGSVETFSDMMNSKAKELGCVSTNFVNPNGIHNENHYSSAYDLALISRAFFQDEMLCKIGNTARYHFEPTATQPDDFYLNNKHKLITGEIAYDGIRGGKTGYTDEARQTLVTCAEQNGMKLICVVFKEESPAQFTDTVELFDYGFHNFQAMNISENEEDYNIDTTGYLQIGNDIFGNSKPILSIDTESCVIVPNTIDFDDLDSEIDYSVSGENCVAQILYSYQDTYVGNAYLNLADNSASTYDFDTNMKTTDISVEKADTEAEKVEEQNTIFINVKKVLIMILIFAALIIILFVLRALVINSKNAKRRKNRVKRKQRRRARIQSDFDDFDF